MKSIDYSALQTVVRTICAGAADNGAGAILVFLPGQGGYPHVVFQRTKSARLYGHSS